MTKRIVFPREVLLVEVERWCREPTCGARVRLSLTKDEARSYTGFECERCGRWFWESLSERDIPEWWEELNVASLRGLKPSSESAQARGKSAGKELKSLEKKSVENRTVGSKAVKEKNRESDEEDDDAEEVGEVVARMSEEWRRAGGVRESAPEVAEDERGDSS